MAVKFDRKAFKATNAEDLKAKEKESGMKSFNRSNGERMTYHSIEQGDNKFRLYPYHPEGKGKTYCEYKTVNFLPIETQKYDDQGEKIEGETTIRKKPIFNAKVHGDYPFDIVEEYVEIGKKLSEKMEKEEAEAYKNKLFHFKDGVSFSRSWVAYADKFIEETPVFGVLEFSNGVKKEINKMVASEGDDEEMSNDPFSDPDEGICLIINKTGQKLNTVYTTSLEQVKKGKFSFDLVLTPLTDEQLEKFMEQKPLYELYRNNYKRKDFEFQVEGLQRIDEENELGIFETEEFLAVLEKFEALLPEEEEESNEKEEPEDEPENKPEPKDEKVEDKEPEVEEKPEPKPEPKAESKEEKEALSGQDRLAALKAKLGKS